VTASYPWRYLPNSFAGHSPAPGECPWLAGDVLGTRESLHQAGIGHAQLAFALPAHLHCDHVAGLLHLPRLDVQIHAVEHGWAMTGEVAPVGGVRSAIRYRPTDLNELDGPPVLTFMTPHRDPVSRRVGGR